MIGEAGWGRLDRARHKLVPLSDPAQAGEAIRRAQPGLAHGMARSYGDQALNPGGALWLTRGIDRFVHFDEAQGLLQCEAGMLLRDIQGMAIPRGWSLPVTPGTLIVTVGGAIANDVHGKNHHRLGSFADHVERLELVRTDGEVIECGPQTRREWFEATVGGMGLTGLIVRATLRLRRTPGPWFDTETLPFRTLDEFFALADASEADWEHTVAWIDCLSPSARGLFMRGNPVAAAQGPQPPAHERRMPFTPPISLVNGWSLRAFNVAYYHRNKGAGRRVEHYVPFLHPLDHVHEWNRMYGPRGFFQYQSVVPPASRRDATDAMLREIRASGEGSFLAVLKTFGARSSIGMLGFPMPGVTLALDFPNQGERTHALFARLDAIVREAGGRIYTAKDARMPRDLFERGYPRLPEFLAYRDPGIRSAMSLRLMGS